MTDKDKLMELVDAYAEARHIQGHSTYNIKTEAARQAVIEALSGVQALSAAPAVPVGWKLVPVEPTADQEWAGKNAALRCSTMGEACKIYKAMLAASPPAEQTFITPETGNSVSAKGAAITSESGAVYAELCCDEVSRAVDVVVERCISLTQDATGIKVVYDPIILANALRTELRGFADRTHALRMEQAASKVAPESFLDGADVQDESGVLAYYSREAVLACITAALESVAAPKAAPGVGDELRDTLVAVSAAIAERDDRAAQKMIREILAASPTPPAEQPTPNTGHAEADRLIGRLMSSDPDFEDCRQAAALIQREIRGPDGFGTWRDAAIAERLARVNLQAAPKAEPGEPVHGDVLPPVGSRVYIRHGRDNGAHACTVTGYYAWGDLGGDKRLHRVFVRLVYEGTDTQQARMLCDCHPTAEAALSEAAPQQEAQEPVAVPRFNCWSTNEGDSWFDHPADSQAIYDCLGNDAKVGDEYELTAGWTSVTARYRITEVVGDGEEYEVECISHPHENSAPQPAPAPLSDDTKDAARYRWLRNKSTVLHGTAWLGSATAYQRDVDFLRRDDALAALDAAIDAAIAAQGGKV